MKQYISLDYINPLFYEKILPPNPTPICIDDGLQ